MKMSLEEFDTYSSCVPGIGVSFGSPLLCKSSVGLVATTICGATPGSNTGLPSLSLPSSGSNCLSSAARVCSSVAGGAADACHPLSSAFDSHQRPSAQRYQFLVDPSCSSRGAVLMARHSETAPFAGRSAGSPSTSTSSEGEVRNRIGGGSFLTGTAFCLERACTTARLACSAWADNGQRSLVTAARSAATYFCTSCSAALGKRALVMRTALSVPRSLDLSISVRALSSITPKPGSFTPGASTDTAARPVRLLSAQRSTCGWYTVISVPSGALVSRGQATSDALDGACAEAAHAQARTMATRSFITGSVSRPRPACARDPDAARRAPRTRRCRPSSRPPRAGAARCPPPAAPGRPRRRAGSRRGGRAC